MTTIDDGLQAWVGAAAVGDLLPTIVSPGDVLSRMAEVNARYASLGKLVDGSSKVLQAFRESWAVLKSTWDAFYKDHGDGHWLDRFISARELSNQIDRFDEEYQSAFAEFQIEDPQGAHAGIPPPSPDPSSPKGQGLSDASATIKTVAYVAAGVTALFGVGYVINAVKR